MNNDEIKKTNSDSDSDKNKKTVEPNKKSTKNKKHYILTFILPKTYGQWLQLLLMFLWLLLVGYLLQQQDIRKWQVESINNLQQNNQELSVAINNLQLKQKEYEEQTKDIISQKDLHDLKQKLQAFGENTGKKVTKQLKNGVNSLFENPIIKQKIQNMEGDMLQIGQDLKTLFKQTSKQTNKQKTLSKEEFNQWMLYINIQWKLKENIPKTLMNLKSLEMVVRKSKVVNKLNIIKAIGQDIEVLKNLQKNKKNLSVVKLKEWVKQLSKTPPIAKKNKISDKATNSNDSNQKLMNKFSSLFSIRKRVDAQDLSQVEVMVLQEVLLQRALLLVDQIQWSLDTLSIDLLQKNIQRLEDLIKRYYPSHQKELNTQLMPFKHAVFGVVPILHIVESL